MNDYENIYKRNRIEIEESINKKMSEKLIYSTQKTFSQSCEMNKFVNDICKGIVFLKSPFELNVKFSKNILNEPFKINLININNESKEISNSSKHMYKIKKIKLSTNNLKFSNFDIPTCLFIGNNEVKYVLVKSIFKNSQMIILDHAIDIDEALYKHNFNLALGRLYDYILIDTEFNYFYNEIIKRIRKIESKYSAETKIAVILNNSKKDLQLIPNNICKLF